MIKLYQWSESDVHRNELEVILMVFRILRTGNRISNSIRRLYYTHRSRDNIATYK